MTNAKSELEYAIGDKTIEWAWILLHSNERNRNLCEQETLYTLEVGHDPIAVPMLLNVFDFDYDNEVSFEECDVFDMSRILFTDGSWLEREIFDCDAMWTLKETPETPKECISEKN